MKLKRFMNQEIPEKYFTVGSVGIMLIFSIIPLFLEMPYRVNLYVTYEGAYRMWLGQIPFRDFGMPIGYGFWLIPYLSFLLFGPYMISLLKAQAIINFVSFMALKRTLESFNVKRPVVLLSLLFYGLTFSLINFWPWYNHSVFVFELLALMFLFQYINGKKRIHNLILSSLFIILAILTKQDGGGLTLLLCTTLLGVHFIYSKEWKGILVFTLSMIVSVAVLILPFLQYDFGYWFNYGQEPHFSRIRSIDLIKDFFAASDWIKGYALLITIVLIIHYKSWKEYLSDTKTVLFSLLTIGILAQAAIIQVTSFSPPTGNLYFHTFSVAFLLYMAQSQLEFKRLSLFLLLSLGIIVWRSENTWKYSQKVFAKIIPQLFAPPPPNVVSKGNWAADDTVKVEPVIWQSASIKSLKGMKLPANTQEGINVIMNLDLPNDPKVLNMSNLTSLAFDLNYRPESGEETPLWYHKNVAFFNRELIATCNKIDAKEYDLILFEDMPNVDNYYPYDVRQCALDNNYVMVGKYLSPTGYTTDSLEVYIKPSL